MSISLVSEILLAFWLGNASAEVAGDKARDPSIDWVRAVVEQETEFVVLSTRLPFVFRTTTGPDKSCEGWVRTEKALRAWVACVNKRSDFRQLGQMLAVKDATVHSGFVYAGADPKADDIALEIGGIKGWPGWRGVLVNYLWTTVDLRLFGRSEGGKLKFGALIFRATTHLN